MGQAPANQSSSYANPIAQLSDKELRRLKRVDLLELLVEQGRELERTRAELEQVKAQLNDKRIMMDKCGSIAEASLALNDVFKAAQAAADQYVENVRRAANASMASGAAGSRSGASAGARPAASAAPGAPAAARSAAPASAAPSPRPTAVPPIASPNQTPALPAAGRPGSIAVPPVHPHTNRADR